jgi:hypothetical protein
LRSPGAAPVRVSTSSAIRRWAVMRPAWMSIAIAAKLPPERVIPFLTGLRKSRI